MSNQNNYNTEITKWFSYMACIYLVIGTGIGVYIASELATAMWISGIMQGLMWRAYDDYGNLAYTFVESVAQMHPYYAMRAAGGLIFFSGACVMLLNVTLTIRQAINRQTQINQAIASDTETSVLKNIE